MAEHQVEPTVEKAKGDVLISLRARLHDGKLDEAKQLEREELVPGHIVTTIANSVFDTLMMEREFLRALELARKYELTVDKIGEAILQQFRYLESKNEFERALEWGQKNGIANFEITRAIIKWIEHNILQGIVEKAVEIKTKFNISHEQIGSLWQQGYDRAFEEGRFFDAALLSREFGSSERKTMLTAAKAFKKAIMENDKQRIIDIDREFRFFNEDRFTLLGEEESKTVVDSFQSYLRSKFRKGDSKEGLEIIEGVHILYGDHANHFLKGLTSFIYKETADAHGILLEMDKYDDAKKVFDDIDFTQEKIPTDLKRKVTQQAVEYHNRILQKGNIDQAKRVKDEYQLLGMYSPAETINSIQDAAGDFLSECIRRGEFKKAAFIMEEYNIPQPEVLELVTKDVKTLLEEEKFTVVFDILMKYKVNTNDEEIRDAALKGFEKCMEKGYYEIAADLGHIFELNIPRVKEAAKIVWERFMEAEDYQKARVVKRKHKLPRKDTHKIARQHYSANMERNKSDIAKKIREDYSIDVGFVAWLMEVIRTILRLLGF